jgi:hypothetical protein
VVEHMSPFWLLAALASKQYMSMGSALICRINIPHIIHSIVVQLFYLLWWHSAIVGVQRTQSRMQSFLPFCTEKKTYSRAWLRSTKT